MTARRPLLLVFVLAIPSLTLAAGFDASVSFARKAALGLAVSGTVQKLPVAAGAHVTHGQLLLALDDTPFRAGVEQAEAEAVRQTANRDEAARDLKQAQELYQRTVLSTVELDNARLKATRAEAALKEARARLTQARYALAHSRITAPFDGWVLEVRTEAGSTVVNTLEAHTLVVLAAEGEYLARGRVSGATLDTLKIGQTVSVSVDGKSHPGRVQALGLEPVSGKTGSDALYDVAVAFQVPGAPLRAGLAARIELP
jgi:RND family efflux transporter MFP subunit